MYVHPAFKVDSAEALAMLRDRAFGLFVVTTALDRRRASAVPRRSARRRRPAGRTPRRTRQSLTRHIGHGTKALLACGGPDAYISPDWYGVPNQVPTWTYTSVHVPGTARLMPESGMLAHVDRLSAYFEDRLLPKKPWTSAKMDETRRAAMLRAIVGIEIEVEIVEAQRKLIQHKGQTEHAGAIGGLRATRRRGLRQHSGVDGGNRPQQVRDGISLALS